MGYNHCGFCDIRYWKSPEVLAVTSLRNTIFQNRAWHFERWGLDSWQQCLVKGEWSGARSERWGGMAGCTEELYCNQSIHLFSPTLLENCHHLLQSPVAILFGKFYLFKPEYQKQQQQKTVSCYWNAHSPHHHHLPAKRKICWNPNPQTLRAWPYLEIRSLQV